MRFDIMTLFPELTDRINSESIVGRAREAGFIEVCSWNIRDYSDDKRHRVDDTPYGGGMGMLMAAPPVYNCYEAVVGATPEFSRRRVIYMSPQGRVLTQKRAAELARDYDQLIILCGHYEGIDSRVTDEIVDEEISIGDYILTGGELAACVLTDCVARLCDGVLSDSECYMKESLTDGLLEYPQYTRPFEFHGVTVPDVLISGHHANIEKWRAEKSREITERKRPDLINLTEKEDKA